MPPYLSSVIDNDPSIKKPTSAMQLKRSYSIYDYNMIINMEDLEIHKRKMVVIKQMLTRYRITFTLPVLTNLPFKTIKISRTFIVFLKGYEIYRH